MFEGDRVVCAYRCDWDDDLTCDDAHYSRAALQRLIPSVDSAALDEFEQHLRPTDLDELFEADPSKLFARVVGLEHYDWLDYHHIARGLRESPDEYRGVIEIP